MEKAKKKPTLNHTLYKKAKKEFEKAFAQYADLMHRLTGIVFTGIDKTESVKTINPHHV